MREKMNALAQPIWSMFEIIIIRSSNKPLYHRLFFFFQINNELFNFIYFLNSSVDHLVKILRKCYSRLRWFNYFFNNVLKSSKIISWLLLGIYNVKMQYIYFSKTIYNIYGMIRTILNFFINKMRHLIILFYINNILNKYVNLFM